jgi:hypothetical protein
MSAPEERFGEAVHDALHRGEMTPSSDLFNRVVDSIDADRQRRRRTRVTVVQWVAAVALVVIVTILVSTRSTQGVHMPWWTLELATNAVLIGLALWLGPFIKRFGRAYAADVFHDNPLTGKSYIVLTDVVYYLIFAAYILMTAHVQPQDNWPSFEGLVTTEQVGAELWRIGGILLVIGVLHGVNIVLMPVLGRLFSLNRRLPPGTMPRRLESESEADRSIYRRAAELERAADDDNMR